MPRTVTGDPERPGEAEVNIQGAVAGPGAAAVRRRTAAAAPVPLRTSDTFLFPPVSLCDNGPAYLSA